MFNRYIEAISKSDLFCNIGNALVSELLKELCGEIVYFKKGQALLRENDTTDKLGIIVSGRADATHITMDGRRIIAAHLNISSVYGDALAANKGTKSPVTVTALEHNTAAVLIPYEKIIESGNNVLFRNLTSLLAAKYFELHHRIGYIICPDLRNKILTYLYSLCNSECGKAFTVPFNREQLAEYLNANRSALSRELSRMKSEGILDYRGNSFTLKPPLF